MRGADACLVHGGAGTMRQSSRTARRAAARATRWAAWETSTATRTSARASFPGCVRRSVLRSSISLWVIRGSSPLHTSSTHIEVTPGSKGSTREEHKACSCWAARGAASRVVVLMVVCSSRAGDPGHFPVHRAAEAAAGGGGAAGGSGWRCTARQGLLLPQGAWHALRNPNTQTERRHMAHRLSSHLP